MSVSALSLGQETTDEELKAISEEFEPEIAFATGFGAEGCVIIAMLSNIRPGARVFYLDTDLLFPETYALRDRLAARFGVRFERRGTRVSLDEQAREYGDRLWERQPNLCCQLRKVQPLKEMLCGLRAWGTAVRRDQSPTRAHIGLVERDKQFGLIKINPLAAWSAREVWDYIARYD